MPQKTSIVCAFVITALCVLCTYVQARLGETREQCDKRYGRVVDVDARENGTEYVKYEKNGLVVDSTFYNDKAVRIMFKTKINRDLLDMANATNLVKINAEGATWSKPYQDGDFARPITLWVRSDAGIATYWTSDAAAWLVFFSSAYDQMMLVKFYDDPEKQASTLRGIAQRKEKYKMLLEEGGVSGF